ncbi:2'-5' RNA ligase family protein [Microbacterium esteraromaticum]|nr:2'-5' RNA ligase family protein [Microbacterium esteraromaticum]WDH80263.1 2'-5' RNA ligase family protein [Microbacterium esteraromaticum]
MNTPRQLESLDGQQYLVLRPTSRLADRYATEQGKALGLAGLPHPHSGHVTLRGFYEPSRLKELSALVHAWACEQQPIEIIGQAVDAFPAPWQILILRLARSSSLVSAYATLTDMLDATSFRRLGDLPLADWTFHMSIVYGETQSRERWKAIESARVHEFEQPLHETVTEVELVSYARGEEHSEVIQLGRLSARRQRAVLGEHRRYLAQNDGFGGCHQSVRPEALYGRDRMGSLPRRELEPVGGRLFRSAPAPRFVFVLRGLPLRSPPADTERVETFVWRVIGLILAGPPCSAVGRLRRRVNRAHWCRTGQLHSGRQQARFRYQRRTSELPVAGRETQV